MPVDIRQKLLEQVGRFQSAPFLFVGSGLSRRYVNLETWDTLLRQFSRGLPYPFEYYRSSADGDLPTVASLIARDFHELWWRSDDYTSSRSAFAGSASSKVSCLKYEISCHIAAQKHVHGRDPDVDREIAFLKKGVIDGIITTNWDTFLESAFPDFKVYVGQGAILSAHPQGIAEIYKIHGCSSVPDSLTLTSEDYEEFERRNPYLAAKLLTIFVEHPVIFLGYSLTDRNVQSILGQVASCLSPAEIEVLKDRLIFVQWDSAGKGDGYESTVMQVGGQNISVTIVRVADFLPVYEALANGKRKFPARILRGMKEQLYELVKTNDPLEKMFVVDIDKAENFSDLEVVYGIGISEKIGAFGYAAIQVDDLLKDLMEEGSEFDYERVANVRLPELLKNAKYVPIFKYLAGAGLIDPDGNLSKQAHPRIIKAVKEGHSRFLPPRQYRKKEAEVQSSYSGVADIAAKVGAEHAIFLIPLVAVEKLRQDELKQFILANMRLMNSTNAMVKTYFRSVMCLYDWVAHYIEKQGYRNDLGSSKKSR